VSDSFTRFDICLYCDGCWCKNRFSSYSMRYWCWHML